MAVDWALTEVYCSTSEASYVGATLRGVGSIRKWRSSWFSIWKNKTFQWNMSRWRR